MPTVELQLPEDTWLRARRSAEASHATLEQWLVSAIERTAATEANPMLGLFSQEPDLMDVVSEDAMAARERHPYARRPTGRTMNRTLLDTDIFSEVLKAKDPKVIARASAYHAHFGRYTIASVTVMEVIKGLHKLQQPARVQQFLGHLSVLEVLSLDAAAAEIAGRIYADLERTGQTIGRADPMIAAIAIQRGLVLATGNEDHFQRIVALGYPLQIDNWRL